VIVLPLSSGWTFLRQSQSVREIGFGIPTPQIWEQCGNIRSSLPFLAVLLRSFACP